MPPASENPNPKTEDRNQPAEGERQDSDDETQDVEISPARTYTQVRHVSGPIPSAEEFARYEEAYPGSADRILSMAEREQNDIVAFRTKALVAATIVAVVTITAIAFILSATPNALILLALATAHVLPSIADFIRGMNDSALTKKERELEIQIRKDNHELDMIAAKQRLELGSGADDSVTQRANRLEAGNESGDMQESNQ